MKDKFDIKDLLKIRHFVAFDEANAQQKIESLREPPKLFGWQKLKTFLKQLFKFNQEN